MRNRPVLIDATQYSDWSEKIFKEMNEAGLSAVCVTICYHENFRETVARIIEWNRRFALHTDRIVPCHHVADIHAARESGRTGIIFALQNCSSIEEDIGLVEILYALGVRIMQLTYNNQSLLATGCYEAEDGGVTRFGKQVIAEMNRLGMIIDMSHSGERSTLQAIDLSTRPIAITHANPASWHPGRRNKSLLVLKRLAESGGMLGFSLYPHHLRNGTACAREDFCRMVADTAELLGIERVGIGSDLCQDQPDSIVRWMRNGRWNAGLDYGEGSAAAPGFPEQPAWFRSNLDLPALKDGLVGAGLSDADADKVLGENWLRFFKESFAAGSYGSTANGSPVTHQ